MKKILFVSLFLMAANFSFAQDKCDSNCHIVKHNCNVGCKKENLNTTINMVKKDTNVINNYVTIIAKELVENN